MRREILKLTPIHLAVLGGAAALGAAILGLKVLGFEDEFTRDAVRAAGVPAWTGAISTAGLLVWGAVAGAAGIAGTALWLRRRREEALFLLTAALGIGLLGVDDALLLHDGLFPNILGISEEVVFAAIGAVVAAWAFRFRVLVLESDLLLLGLMVFAGGGSAFIDVFDLWSTAGEDWLKYLALAALGGWVVDTSLRLLVPDEDGKGLDVAQGSLPEVGASYPARRRDRIR